MITESIEVAGLRIARGDGDTDPNFIYFQSVETEDWIAFPITDIGDVIEAVRTVSREGA